MGGRIFEIEADVAVRKVDRVQRDMESLVALGVPIRCGEDFRE